MIFENFCIFTLYFASISAMRHQKPLEKTIWNERCKRNSVALNDCNWCWCDANQRYQCKARVCEEVDMFGHFKDAIRDIDVGMEGKGSWRTKRLACSPNVHYRRGDTLCICDDDGDWPNPVCRDLFRVLYPVKVTGFSKVKNDETSCTPTKLYLVGCNVCFCPSTGLIDENLCTRRECEEDDPVLEEPEDNKTLDEDTGLRYDDAHEIYGLCNPSNKYLLGCRKCTCLRNNRLLCDDCLYQKQRPNLNSYCYKRKSNEIFKLDCNLCHCDFEQNLLCTAKKCLNAQFNELESHELQPKHNFKLSKAPSDSSDCIPGTEYKKGCNTCKCIKLDNADIVLDCSANVCSKNDPIAMQIEDCVEGTSYEVNCMLCYCELVQGEKREICKSNPICVRKAAIYEKRSLNVNSLHGYCEPLHAYKKDCNNCSCLSDGKTLKCTSKVCLSQSKEKVAIDIVPIRIQDGELCPSGHSYNLDCNLCFCLSNGNALCTTFSCSKKNSKNVI